MASAKSIATATLPALLLGILTVTLYYVTQYQKFCTALVAIVAWNAVVKTLELNDFRHRMKNSPLRGSRYIAALVATRLGLRDALIDWAVIYSVSYAIMAGFTWKDVDPNSLLVLWGFSVIGAAMILGVLGLKVPQWLGLYPKQKFTIIRDVSDLAEPALQALIGTTSQDTEGESEGQGGGTIADFRYQVRIAIGSHFAKFTILLLPFYVGLKPLWFLASVAIGCAFGYMYMYIVYQSRTQFQYHKGLVALFASAYMAVVSSLMFMAGMDIADESWNLDFAKDNNALMIGSFFFWFAFLLLLEMVEYYRYYTFKGSLPRPTTRESFLQGGRKSRPSLFDDSIVDGVDDAIHHDAHLDTVDEVDESGDISEDAAEGAEAEGGENDENPLEEPLMSRREKMEMGYFYQTGYFDPNSMRTGNELAVRKDRGSVLVSTSCTENYNSVCASENKEPMKWYSRVWLALPLKPAWDILVLGCRRTFSCCKKESNFKEGSFCAKFYFIASRIIVIVLNGGALWVALVACVATSQISRTKAKLPYVNEKLYNHMNDEAVCAFDHKGGSIKTFESKEEAHLANYQVVHCGSCGHCSNWIDLELQWSTRKTLAIQSQKCAIQSLMGGIDGLQQCLEGPMIGGTHGFTTDCARCWAEDIICTKKHCVFIYFQTRMTNQVGNFKVGPDSITSATCEEANCEAGNPGEFVYCVGANRRRMNITSGIARPGAQQCEIVDVESWDEFFPPQSQRIVPEQGDGAIELK